MQQTKILEEKLINHMLNINNSLSESIELAKSFKDPDVDLLFVELSAKNNLKVLVEPVFTDQTCGSS